MQLWGVRLRFEGYELVYAFHHRIQAEHYLILIPQLMIDGNAMVEGVKSARLVPVF